MVVAGREDAAVQRELPLLPVPVEDQVAADERRPLRAGEDGVELLLGVVLLGPQRELERDPEHARVGQALLPPPLAQLLDRPDVVLEDEAHRACRRSGCRGRAEGRAEALPRLRREAPELLGLLVLPEEPVVRVDDLFEDDLARRWRRARRPWACASASARPPPRARTRGRAGRGGSGPRSPCARPAGAAGPVASSQLLNSRISAREVSRDFRRSDLWSRQNMRVEVMACRAAFRTSRHRRRRPREPGSRAPAASCRAEAPTSVAPRPRLAHVRLERDLQRRSSRSCRGRAASRRGSACRGPGSRRAAAAG